MSLRRPAVAVTFLCALLAGAAAARAQQKSDEDDAPPAKPAAPAPNLKVVKVSFRGNRKVEDDAIKVNLKTAPGVTLTQEMVRDDVRAIWKMGYFEDIEVEVAENKNGSTITFVLKEKPAINKIYVAGNDEVSLSKINETLDLKKDQILDLAKVKKNVEKIKDAYVEKGFYMAEVSYEIKRDTASTVDVWFHIRENNKVEVRRVNFVGNQ
ncbi:MAG TPA: POTRA domain-containing protein, partial [Polyangia bacterium]